MAKTKIPWCDETWNPVWGCYNNCPYCYAKSIAKRFGKTSEEQNFIPTWRESAFQHKFAKSTKRVFVNSMSDIMYWKPEWMTRVISCIKTMPDIQFIFLTKGGYQAYARYQFPDNVVCGVTVTKFNDFFAKVPGWFLPARHWLLNIEPIHESFDNWFSINYAKDFDWIIIGAETGNRKDKPIPELSWYEGFLIYLHDKPIFLKPSLDSITPHSMMRREYLTYKENKWQS